MLELTGVPLPFASTKGKENWSSCLKVFSVKEDYEIRVVTKVVLMGVIFSTMTLTGCSRGRDYNIKTLDIIFSVIQGYEKEFSKKGIVTPSKVLVHRQPAPTEEIATDRYWSGNNNEFTEISKETWLVYQKGKMPFNGNTGDYYYFSFMLFAEDEDGKTRGGVLFLPDGNEMSFELKK